MSLRFEKLMAEHRFNETAADLTDSDLLAQLVDRYNNFRSNVAIKKWQISDDMRRSIEGIILGMNPCPPRSQQMGRERYLAGTMEIVPHLGLWNFN